MQRRQILLSVPRFERGVIAPAVLFVNGDGRVPVQYQQIIHDETAGAPVSVRERVNVLELGMEVGRGREGLFAGNVLQLGQQFRHLFRRVFGRGLDFFASRHEIVTLVFAGALAELPAPRVVRVLRQQPLQFLDEFFRQRAALIERVQKRLVGFPGVAKLE